MTACIKQLEWNGPTQMALVAEPFPQFKYTILDDDRGVDWSVSADKIGWFPAHSVDEAKAACQSDFDRRVSSWIDVSDEMVAAGVEEIRKSKHQGFDRWTDEDAIRAVLTASLKAA